MRRSLRAMLCVATSFTVFLAVAGTAEAAAFRGGSCALRSAGQWGGNEGPTDRTVYANAATGSLKATMLFVDFAGAEATETTQNLYARVGEVGSTYLRQASNGKLNLKIQPVHRWLRLPASAARLDTSTFDGQQRLMQLAANAATRSYDFRATKLLYVVASERGARFNSPAFIAGTPSSGIKVDGVSIRYGATFGQDWRGGDNWGGWILAHETGHTFGLPDLYELGARPGVDFHRFVGAWDTMGNLYVGPQFTQWHRRKLGWLGAKQFRCLTRGAGGTFELHPAAHRTGVQLIAIPTGPSTAVTIARRAKLGVEAQLCDPGVLVTRINARTATGKGPVRVVPASTSQDGCGTLGNAAFARGEGERCSLLVDGIRIEVVTQTDATSTVRVRPARGTAPDPRVASCA